MLTKVFCSPPACSEILSRYNAPANPSDDVHRPPLLKVTATEVSIASKGPHAASTSNTAAVNHANVSKALNPALAYLMQKLRGELKVRVGGIGFLALQRRFREVQANHVPYLIMGEFRQALRSMEVSLSDHEIRSLFSLLDKDSLGQLDFMGFMDSLCGPMSEKRQRLVDVAFSLLDIDGGGAVEAGEIGARYDPNRHPEVLAGRSASREVLSQVTCLSLTIYSSVARYRAMCSVWWMESL